MLAQDGNGPTDFEDGNEDGWPARRRKKKKKEPSKTQRHKKTPQKTHHAMGNVTNNEINCIKLKPMDFAPSDSSKRPPSDNVS